MSQYSQHSTVSRTPTQLLSAKERRKAERLQRQQQQAANQIIRDLDEIVDDVQGIPYLYLIWEINNHNYCKFGITTQSIKKLTSRYGTVMADGVYVWLFKIKHGDKTKTSCEIELKHQLKEINCLYKPIKQIDDYSELMRSYFVKIDEHNNSLRNNENIKVLSPFIDKFLSAENRTERRNAFKNNRHEFAYVKNSATDKFLIPEYLEKMCIIASMSLEDLERAHQNRFSNTSLKKNKKRRSTSQNTKKNKKTRRQLLDDSDSAKDESEEASADDDSDEEEDDDAEGGMEEEGDDEEDEEPLDEETFEETSDNEDCESNQSNMVPLPNIFIPETMFRLDLQNFNINDRNHSESIKKMKYTGTYQLKQKWKDVAEYINKKEGYAKSSGSKSSLGGGHLNLSYQSVERFAIYIDQHYNQLINTNNSSDGESMKILWLGIGFCEEAIQFLLYFTDWVAISNDSLQERNFFIVGLEIDEDTCLKATELVKRFGLQSRIKIFQCNIMMLTQKQLEAVKFDIVYTSAAADPQFALKLLILTKAKIYFVEEHTLAHYRGGDEPILSSNRESRIQSEVKLACTAELYGKKEKRDIYQITFFNFHFQDLALKNLKLIINKKLDEVFGERDKRSKKLNWTSTSFTSKVMDKLSRPASSTTGGQRFSLHLDNAPFHIQLSYKLPSKKLHRILLDKPLECPSEVRMEILRVIKEDALKQLEFYFKLVLDLDKNVSPYYNK